MYLYIYRCGARNTSESGETLDTCTHLSTKLPTYNGRRQGGIGEMQLCAQGLTMLEFSSTTVYIQPFCRETSNTGSLLRRRETRACQFYENKQSLQKRVLPYACVIPRGFFSLMKSSLASREDC